MLLIIQGNEPTIYLDFRGVILVSPTMILALGALSIVSIIVQTQLLFTRVFSACQTERPSIHNYNATRQLHTNTRRTFNQLVFRMFYLSGHLKGFESANVEAWITLFVSIRCVQSWRQNDIMFSRIYEHKQRQNCTKLISKFRYCINPFPVIHANNRNRPK